MAPVRVRVNVRVRVRVNVSVMVNVRVDTFVDHVVAIVRAVYTWDLLQLICVVRVLGLGLG